MSGRINAQIDLTKIYQAMKENHSAIQESASDGHVRVNVTIWINDEVKEFPSKKEGGKPTRQDTGIILNSQQNASAEEKAAKFYIGNGLSTFAGGGTGANAEGFGAFAGKGGASAPKPPPPSDDDLPF